MSIKAIPTTRNGENFKSKLEADFSDLLNEAGVKWSYEMEGYDCDGLWYLPDFWLPECRTFVEVKGVLDMDSDKKVRSLAAAGLEHDFTVVLAQREGTWTFLLVTETGYKPGKWRGEAFGPEVTQEDIDEMNRIAEWRQKNKEAEQLRQEEQKRRESLPVKTISVVIGGDEHGVPDSKSWGAFFGTAEKLLDTGKLVVKVHLNDSSLSREIREDLKGSWTPPKPTNPLDYILLRGSSGERSAQTQIDDSLTKRLVEAETFADFCDGVLASTQKQKVDNAAELQKKLEDATSAAAALKAELSGFLGGVL